MARSSRAMTVETVFGFQFSERQQGVDGPVKPGHDG
jgi:hypothetical protein